MLSPLAVTACPATVRVFRAVEHARVYGAPVLVVAHLRHDRLFLALLVRLDACMHGLQVSTHLRNFSLVELFFPNFITTYISNSIYFKLITIN
jgi:hypothetical protein